MSTLPPPIRGLLFDKDGTLLSFEQSWTTLAETMLDRIAPDARAWAAMADAAGYDPGRGTFRAGSVIVCDSTAALAALWAPWRPDLGAARIEEMLNAAAAADAAGASPAVPDLAGLLDRLAAPGRHLGVATHDAHAAAEAQLAALGVRTRFAFVAGYDSGHGQKPQPGMLRGFCAATGLDPQAVAVIGDSLHDLMMARLGGAGLAIGVLTGPASESDLAPHAHHVLPSIGALPDLLDAGLRKGAAE